jgi:DNA-binding NarL/FixJ family response regulator
MSSSAEPQPTRQQSGAWSARRPTDVLVIDPVPLFRDGLAALIERTPGVRMVGATANMHSAVALCERLHPDVVMVDAVLDPRCHLAQLLTGADESCTVLSVVREPLRIPRYVATALSSGIQGLVLRSAEPTQMLEAIRRTHLERRYLDPELAALATGLGVRHTVTARQPLSRREYQVLQLISDGLENQAIAKALFVSVETIRTHVKSILRKLHARDRAHAVAVAFRLGVLVAHRETGTTDVPVARTPAAAGQQVPRSTSTQNGTGHGPARGLPHLPHGQVQHGQPAVRAALAGSMAQPVTGSAPAAARRGPY